MEITLEIKVFRKSILFYKYLPNRSSDLYEILCGGQFLSCEPELNLWINVCARVVNARGHVISRMSAFTTCARAFKHGSSWNLKTEAHKIVIDHHMKFHKDPSICWGDICKTILTFWILFKIWMSSLCMHPQFDGRKGSGGDF